MGRGIQAKLLRLTPLTSANGVAKLGYQHEVIRKNSGLGGKLLPLANRVASRLKRWLLGTHQGAVAHSHLEYYLDEYSFRFDRRTSRSRGLLFYRLPSPAVDLGPALETDLKALKTTPEQ